MNREIKFELWDVKDKKNLPEVIGNIYESPELLK